jgi:hypothetical protein
MWEYRKTPEDRRILPDVRRWSDIVFVEWETQANQRGVHVGGLKYVFRHNIQNAITLDVIEYLATGHIIAWPGLLFKTCTAGGRALVGVPNGRGIAWLLASHKEAFRGKTIESVRVWAIYDAYDKPTYHMLFTIGPLPSEDRMC